MRRFLLILAFAAGLSSAKGVDNCIEIRMQSSCDALAGGNSNDCRMSIKRNGRYLFCDSLRVSEVPKVIDSTSYDTTSNKNKCSSLPPRLKNDCESSFLRGSYRYVVSKSELAKETNAYKLRERERKVENPDAGSGYGYVKHCVHGIPCGGTCISASKTCRH